MSPPPHMSPDITFCFITELLYSGLCLSSRSHQSVTPGTGSFQLYAVCWVLSKDAFCLLHPQMTFCLCLGSWRNLSMYKTKVHFVPLCPTFNFFFLMLSPVLLQMFLQLHLFKSQPAEKRHMQQQTWHRHVC